MKKLLFYYPQHFNRSKNGTNPFFDKLLAICDVHGIDYDLYEEPDYGTDKPRNPRAKKADIFFWSVTVIRKIMSILFHKKSFYVRERYSARIFNLITFGKYIRPVYITISGSMFHFFAELNHNAPVYDLQHGVLGKFHPTFFDKNTLRLREEYYWKNLHFMFWGKGYRDCFIRGEEQVMVGRHHVVGYPIENSNITDNADHSSSRQIVVSLQFTHDVCMEELENMKSTLCRFLEETEFMGVKVLLKNHPRYNNCIEIADIFELFHHAELTDRRLEDLAPETLLHVTYFSTTGFEYAQYGVPTFFLPYGGKELKDTLYYDEYAYPLYLGMSAKAVINRLAEPKTYRKDASTVQKWYKDFYSLFDEKAFLNLLKR